VVVISYDDVASRTFDLHVSAKSSITERWGYENDSARTWCALVVVVDDFPPSVASFRKSDTSDARSRVAPTFTTFSHPSPDLV